MNLVSSSKVKPEDRYSPVCGAGEQADARLQAVLALLSGEPIEEVQVRFDLSRSSLYTYRRRALEAMREALKEKKRGPRRPHNRLSEEREESVRRVCERHPTFSSYQVKEQMGNEAPPPRTIQRLRRRLSLPRLPKRDLPRRQRKRFSAEEKCLISETT